MHTFARWRVWLANLILRLPRSASFKFTAGPAGPSRDVHPIAARMTPPEDELGVAVPAQKVLRKGAEAVVGVTGCVAFTTGFQLSVGIRKKHLPPPVAHPMLHPEPVETRLRIGVRFADGRETDWQELRAYHEAFAAGEDAPVPAGPVISGAGGGGGAKSLNMSYWIWPLPPDGPVTVTCHWPEGGVPDGQAELDGSAIRRAGESSRKLWAD
jgi:hypothetical protein